MSSFEEQLQRWGFRRVDSNGQPFTTDKPAPQKQPDESVREIAKKILSDAPNVKL